MSVTRSALIARLVRKNIAGGYEKKESLPAPGARFQKLGTIFSRTTGLIKSGVIPPTDIPVWYSIYRAFPPKYEPRFNRPPLDVEVKEIYYPEDKLRAAMKRWQTLDLKSTKPNNSQTLVESFKSKRTTRLNDDALIKELLADQTKGRDEMAQRDEMVESALR